MRYSFVLVAACIGLVAGSQEHSLETTDKRPAWFSSQKSTLEELKKEFPTIDPDAVARFFEDGHHVSKRLTEYMQWQSGHSLSSVDNDVERWNMATQQGFEYVAKRKPGKLRGVTVEHTPDKEIIFDTELMDHHGHPVLQFFPCLLDLNLAGAVPLYTDIIASYIESFFAGVEKHEKFTLLFDIRPGRGWPNPSNTELMNAVKSMAGSIHRLQPGRVFQVLIYPVPSYGTKAWNVVKPFVDKNLRDEIVLIPGSSVGIHGPTPVGALTKYVDRNVVDVAEKKRHSLFSEQTATDELIEEEGAIVETVGTETHEN